jgi:hypothetical protein
MATFSLVGQSQTVCEGGWQYEQWNKCRLSTNECEATTTTTVYSLCRAAVKDAALGCGPEIYALCQNSKCPGSTQDYQECQQWDGPDCARWTMVPGKAAFCRADFCPVETWKQCRHNTCPVESQNTTCTLHKEAYSASCEGTKAQLVTVARSEKPANEAVDGKRATDFYGLGSSCITCDDIPTDSAANIQRKFDCLAKGIELAEQQKPGYSFKATFHILQQLQNLGMNFSASLRPDQSIKLAEILSKYNIGG